MRDRPRGNWLRDARRAAQVVADRPDLWAAGALGWLAYGGIFVFLGAIVPFPTPADLAFFGAGLAVSGSVAPAVALGAALLGAFVTFVVLHAIGEAVLAAELDGGRGWLAGVAGVIGVHLVAAIPVAGAALVLAQRLSVVGPAEYQSPDIGGPLLLRIVGGVLPFAILALVVLVAAQVVVAGASWRVASRRRASLPAALRDGAHDAIAEPVRLAGIALATLAGHAIYAALVFLMLRVLWAPIGAALAVGQARDIAVTGLLVGFVAIWACLVLGGGALHAWASAWWAIALDERAVAAASATAGEPRTHEGAPV